MDITRIAEVIILLLFVLSIVFFIRRTADMSFARCSLFCLVHIVLIYAVFEGVNQLANLLRGKSVYLDFGHASLELVMLLVGMMLTYVLLAIGIALKRFV